MATAAGLLPSLFDRLTDPNSMGTAAAPGQTLFALEEAVRRDVEELLNSRRPSDPDLAQFPELDRSVYAYGLPDLTALPALSGPDRAAIGRRIADVIARHEPRLRDVRATLLGTDAAADRNLRFRVEAKLRLDPAPGVTFETVLELATGRTVVRQVPT